MFLGTNWVQKEQSKHTFYILDLQKAHDNDNASCALSLIVLDLEYRCNIWWVEVPCNRVFNL